MKKGELDREMQQIGINDTTLDNDNEDDSDSYITIRNDGTTATMTVTPPQHTMMASTKTTTTAPRSPIMANGDNNRYTTVHGYGQDGCHDENDYDDDYDNDPDGHDDDDRKDNDQHRQQRNLNTDGYWSH